MTTAATSLLGLALPVTGELSGTWGDTVNNSITSLLDSAIAGTTTLSTDGDVTLTTTTLATNQARQAILLCSGARTAVRNITAPAQSKIYTVINATTGGYAVVIRGAGPTTGVSVPAGRTMQVAWNGSDFVDVSTSFAANGTANAIVYLNASKVPTTGTALQFDGQNIGLAKTPSAWPSNRPAIEIGGTTQGTIAFNGSGSMLTNGGAIWFNAVFDGANKYIGNGYANLLNIGGSTNGLSLVGTGTPGTAGDTFSFAANNLLTITQGGKVGIQTNSPTYFLDINSGTSGFGVRNIDTNYSNFIAAGTQGSQYHMFANAASKWIMSTRLDTTYGGTASSWVLWDDVNSQLRLAVDPTNGVLGVRVNPSTLWGSTSPTIQVGQGAFWQARSNDPTVSEIGGNAYFDGGSWKRLTANCATILSMAVSSATHPYFAMNYTATGAANSTITWTPWLEGWDDGTVTVNGPGSGTSQHLANLNVNGSLGLYVYAGNSAADGGVGIKRVSSLTGGIYSLGGNSGLAFYTNNSGSDLLRMNIDSNGVIKQPYQPWTYYKLAGNITGYDSTASNSIIKYDANQGSVGSNYSSSTGLFTAPVTGRYLINASILASTVALTQIWMVLNGGRNNSIVVNPTNNDVCVGTGMVYLTAGDTVGLHAYSGSSSTVTLVANTFHSWLEVTFLG